MARRARKERPAVDSAPAVRRSTGGAPLRFVATTTRGLEGVLAAELVGLGLQRVREDRGAVRFAGSLEDGYRACLWSRVASRVLLWLARFPCPDADALYDGARAIDWIEHIGPDQTLLVEFVGGSETLRHNVFGARKVKDAIVDSVRDVTGRRPDVDLEKPDLRVHVHLRDDVATVSIDLSGDALHLRGGGRVTGPAPLRETLAAGLLLVAGWPAFAAEGRPLVDPMCGSGTLLVEAAAMAADQAPGLLRRWWGFYGWRGHDRATWKSMMAEAEDRARAGQTVRVYGADTDGDVLRRAEANAQARRLGDAVLLARRDVRACRPPPGPSGLVVTNPPYGERLGEVDRLVTLYAGLGDVLRRRFLGWDAWVLTGSPTLAKAIGLRPEQRREVWNGPIECRFLHLPIAEAAPVGEGAHWLRVGEE